MWNPIRSGIYLSEALFCNISNNNIYSSNEYGILLDNSMNNIIKKNNISGPTHATNVELRHSRNNIITENIISDGTWHGIVLAYNSDNNTIKNNVFINDGLYVADSYQNTIENNEVNEKPLVYLEDESDYTINYAGQVIFVNCKNITVENLDLEETSVGIELWGTNYSKIINNKVAWGTRYGIYLGASNNNLISENVPRGYTAIQLEVSNNNKIEKYNVSNSAYGMRLGSSYDNIIYYNNFVDNTYGNLADGLVGLINIWNSPGEITYYYNGTIHTNHLGNYWDDYDGTDANGDGVGDSSYSIDGDKDNYPLMEPFENYTILLELNTDKKSYVQGEKVCLTASTTPSTDVSFEVDYPNTTIHSLYTNQSDASGMATYSFYLEDKAPTGTYSAFASTAQGTASTSFEVTDNTPPQIIDLAHSPTDPQPTDIVTIMADIIDVESNISSATLYYSTDAGESWNNQAMTGDDSFYSTTIGPFAHGTNVQYNVSATNEKGLYSLSLTQSFLVQDTLDPSLSNLAHDPNQPTNEQTLTISVDVVDLGSGIQSIILFTSSDGGTTWTVTLMSASSSTYSVIVGPFDAGIIQYYVNATDNVGNSQVSNTQSFTVVEPSVTLNMSLGGTPTPGGTIQANIRIINTFNTSKSMLVVVQVLDPNGLPLAPVYQWITVEAYSVQDITLTVTIPATAQQGSYLVQGQLLTDFPRNGGYALDYQVQTMVVL